MPVHNVASIFEQDGRWTLGLLECWGSRERLIKVEFSLEQTCGFEAHIERLPLSH